MRIRHLMAALVPAGAASALAILPLAGASAAAAPAQSVARHIAAAAPHRMIPAVQSPVAYKYAGDAGVKGTVGITFSCQEPGAAPSCYTPPELRTAYDIPARLTGAGQTIVIIDAFGEPTIGADVAVEDTTFGLGPTNLHVIYPDGQPPFDRNNPDEVSWAGETALDVESSHAVAPAARIDLVIARSDQDTDILSALRYVVTHHLGSVLSQSYGEAEACQDPSIVRADHLLFAAAARQGMSVFASSADDGAALPSCDGTTFIKAVSVPAADPLVTGVGGTSLTATQPDGTYESETAWNDAFGSSGGGFSTLFRRPAYQRGFVHSAARGVPDVSYSGDVNNGLLIAWSEGLPSQVGDIFTFGGTSAGSPQWAAITALADQNAHHRLGFLNDCLYRLAHGPLYNYVFHDVTTGNNSVTLSDSAGNPVSITGFPATSGWDAVTGLGTPDVAHLLRFLR
jgi:subtilase family serine protease